MFPITAVRCIQPMRCASDGFSWRRTRISSAIWKHRSSRRRRCSRIPKQLGDGTVDYRDVEWFEPVAKGQKLAFYHSAKQGENGTTIKGRVIPARRGREKGILTGKGFRRLEDGKTYFSDMQGVIKQQ